MLWLFVSPTRVYLLDFFCSGIQFYLLCVRLFIYALWPPAGKGLASWLSFVVSNFELIVIVLH